MRGVSPRFFDSLTFLKPLWLCSALKQFRRAVCIFSLSFSVFFSFAFSNSLKLPEHCTLSSRTRVWSRVGYVSWGCIPELACLLFSWSSKTGALTLMYFYIIGNRNCFISVAWNLLNDACTDWRRRWRQWPFRFGLRCRLLALNQVRNASTSMHRVETTINDQLIDVDRCW